MAAPKKYPGALGRPMKARDLEHFVRGVPLLFEHYGIDTSRADKFVALALSLAQDHVTYYQTARKRGPKANPWRMVLLALDVEARKRRGAKSDAAALQQLTGEVEPLVGVEPWVDGDADTLARRRREARKNDPLVDVMYNVARRVASGRDINGRIVIKEADIDPLINDLREELRRSL